MTDATQLPGRQKALTLVGVMLGMLLAALDQTIVATAGPTIQRDLAIEPSLYTWITTSYLVASTVLVPIWGKLSDMLGRRRVLLVGIAVFLGGSVLCGLSQSAAQLIVFRAVQGIGSASLFTSALAVIADLFVPAERGKFQGIFGAVFGLASVAGPLVGGFITDTLGWHWCFFINLPVGVVAVTFIVAKMPPLRRAGSADRRVDIDVTGAVVLGVAVVPLLLALSLGRAAVRPGETGWLWGSWQILGMLAVSLAGFALFAVVEGRARDPIVDLKLFTERTFAIGNLAAFLSGTPFLGAIVFLPLFMVNVAGASATSSGLTTVPLTFGIIAGNIVSGQLVSRTGQVKPFILGAGVVLGLAFALLAFTLTPDTTRLDASLKMFFVGLGLGPGIPLYTLVIQNAVSPQVIGTATSVATFSRQMGSTVGLAVLGTVFATTLSSEMTDKLSAATAGMPPELAAKMQTELAAGPTARENEDTAADSGPAAAAFDRQVVEARVRASFAARRLAQGPSPGLDAAEAAALESVGKIERAIKESFTLAIAQIYVVALVMALLSLLASLWMPVQPLRGRGPPASTPPVVE